MEAALDRLYKRLGTRYFLLCLLVAFGVLVVVGVVTVLVIDRGIPMSTGAFARILAVLLAGGALALLWPGTGWYRRAAAPVLEWVRAGKPAEGAPAAWEAGARLPRAFTLGVGARSIVYSAIPDCVYVTWELGLPARDLLYLVPASMFPVLFGCVWYFLLAEIEMRPVMREAEQHLPIGFRIPHVGVPLLWKIVAGVLPVAIAAGVLVSTIFDAGGGPPTFFAHVAVSTLVGLTLPFVVLLLLAIAIRAPIERLTAATSGVAAGDLSARVPLLAADELGVLSDRFNAMVRDLRRSRLQLLTAREEERRRIRRDLHDGLGPALAALAMRVDAARSLLPRDRAEADRLLADVRADAAVAIADIRNLVYELRPPALDELGLVGALRERAQSFAGGDEGRSLVLSVEAPERLPPLPAAVEVAAYRIAQEAMINAVRHSGAERCRVRVRAEGDLVLEIEDDGRGLDPASRAGVGLSSMRERAGELGGTCHIGALPTGGTRVRAVLPIGLV